MEGSSSGYFWGSSHKTLRISWGFGGRSSLRLVAYLLPIVGRWTIVWNIEWKKKKYENVFVFFREDEKGVVRSQSYNLAQNVMPTSAVMMKNSKITFGFLPDPNCINNSKDSLCINSSKETLCMNISNDTLCTNSSSNGLCVTSSKDGLSIKNSKDLNPSKEGHCNKVFEEDSMFWTQYMPTL